MKKLITFTLLATITATSCSFDKTVDEKQDTIGFGTYVGNSTKATERPTAEALKNLDDQIGMFAFIGNGLNNNFQPNFMNNEPLRYESGWKYDNTKYWPNNGDMISFVAYYPYTSATTATDVTEVPGISNGTVAIKFKTNLTEPAKQKDLLWATITDATKGDKNGAVAGTPTDNVPFIFTHALSKIQFKVKLNGDYSNCIICIKKVTLSGLTTNGTYTIPQNLTEGSWAIEPIVAATNCVAYNEASTKGQIVVKEVKDLGTFANNGLLLIPQTHTTDTKLKLDYEVIYSDNPATGPIAESITFPLIGNWLQNKIYTYTFNMSLNAITFDVTVKGWESNTDTDVVN